MHSDSGMRLLYRELRVRYGGPTVEICYRPWKWPWKDEARRLHQVALPDCPTVVAGHSYGWGYGYKKFSKEWHRCHREVGLAIPVDPIPRVAEVLLPFNIWALTRWGKVKVRYARQVLAYRQVNNIPMGRDVCNGDSANFTRWVYGSEQAISKHAPRSHESWRRYDPDMTHSKIDDAPEIHEEVLGRIDSYIRAHRGE